MYTIKVKFQRFGEIHLADLIGATGVYVIWDAHAKARPTYIGEGNILKRFSDHVNRNDRTFARPWDGYVALMTGSTHGVHKVESKAVERLLLGVAGETDRLPVVNVHPGSTSAVLFLCKRETLRIAVSGFDPFMPPSAARPLATFKEIKIRPGGANIYESQHDWRLRRARTPIVKS